MSKKKYIKASDLFSKKQAFQYSIMMSLLINLILILGVLFGQARSSLSEIEVSWLTLATYFLWHFMCNLVLYYYLFRFNFRLIRTRLKAERIPIFASLATLLICLLVSPVLAQFQWFAVGGEKGIASDPFILFNVIKDVIMGVVVISVTRNIYSNYKREQTIIANQKLMAENIRMRFEALKNQLDPHFLFNSLNTLNGLIGIDDEKAHEYIENLSSVFRYTLNNKNIRTLEEEVGFVEAYTDLLRIRYGDNLTVEYEIDEQYKRDFIMPVSLQLLVENAVKHNVISNRHPLLIQIYTTSHDSITVSNRINPKADPSSGAGVGLSNLTERYSILFRKPITITQNHGTFSVDIPLISRTDKNSRI